MTDANNTEDTPRNGRRATDDKQDETVFSSKTSGLWSVVRNSVGVAFVITVCVGVGRFSHTVDTNVNDIAKHDTVIEKILEQNNKLLVVLETQNIQQKESDKRFEDKFDRVIDQLKDVDDSVRDNKKDIIIMQQKISYKDNTGVVLAMR